jgi:hypothetical protein
MIFALSATLHWHIIRVVIWAHIHLLTRVVS